MPPYCDLSQTECARAELTPTCGSSDDANTIHTIPDMLSNFHQFSKLPAEIRLKIWKLHLRVPRRIEFTPWYTGDKRDSKCRGGESPTLLKVNQESRRESRNFYGRFFGDIEDHTTHDRLVCHDSQRHDGIYINPSIDIVQLSFYTMTDSWLYRDAHDLQYMKRLVIDIDDIERPIPAHASPYRMSRLTCSGNTLYLSSRNLIENLLAWRGLESLTVIISHTHPSAECC